MLGTLITILAAANETGHEESSKTLFYAMGGALAAYAVILGAIGIMRHEFPRSKGAARGVMALSTLLVLATMASSILSS